MNDASGLSPLDETELAEREAEVEPRLRQLRTMANEIASRLTAEQLAFDIDTELYDERGLPA